MNEDNVSKETVDLRVQIGVIERLVNASFQEVNSNRLEFLALNAIIKSFFFLLLELKCNCKFYITTFGYIS